MRFQQKTFSVSSLDTSSPSVHLERIDVDSFFANYMISPGLFTHDPAKIKDRSRVIRFILASILCWTGSLRFLSISSSSVDSNVAYFLGDFTPIFGESRDYFLIMLAIWMTAAGFCVLNSLRVYLNGKTKWTEMFKPLQSLTDIRFVSSYELEAFKRFHKLIVIIRKLVRVLCVSTVVFALMIGYSIQSTYRPITYLATISFFWTPEIIVFAWCVAAWAFTGSFLFILTCYNFRDKLSKITRNVEKWQYDQDNISTDFILGQIDELISELSAHNSFWKRTGASMFLGSAIGLCFDLYIQFFLTLEFYFKVPFLFWGLGGFSVSCFSVLFFAGQVMKNVYQFRHLLINGFITRPSKSTSLSQSIKLLNTIETVSTSQPFTCFDMFSYQNSVLITIILEMGANLMLLISIKKRPGV